MTHTMPTSLMCSLTSVSLTHSLMSASLTRSLTSASSCTMVHAGPDRRPSLSFPILTNDDPLYYLVTLSTGSYIRLIPCMLLVQFEYQLCIPLSPGALASVTSASLLPHLSFRYDPG